MSRNYPQSINNASVKRALLAGSVLSLVAQIIRIATSFISVPLVLGYLGKERFGLWMVTVSTMMFVSLLDAGLSPTVKNRMSLAIGSSDEETFRDNAFTALILGGGIIVVAMIMAPILAAVDWQVIFKVREADTGVKLGPLVIAVFTITVLNFALGPVEGIFAARLDMARVHRFHIVGGVISFALLLVAIKTGAGLACLAFVSTSGPAMARVVLVALLWVNDRSLFKWRSHAFAEVPKLLPSSVGFIGIQLANVAIGALPGIAATRMLGLGETATFNIGQRLSSLPLVAVAAVVPIFWPVFTQAWARGEQAWIRRRFLMMIFLTAAILVAYAIILTSAINLITKLWLSDQITIPRPVIALLCVWLVLQGTGYWLTTLLNSIGDLRVQLVTGIGQFILLGTATFLLMPSFGLAGLVAAMVLSVLLGLVIPLHFRVRRKLNCR